MANIRAIANGNWSNNAIWSPNAPTTADDVFASGFTVFVDTNIQVISINTIGATGIGGGGTFRPNNGVLMRTNVVAGSTTCVTFGSASPNAFSLIGNVSGGNAANIYGINNSSTGNIAITGNIQGGIGSSASGINNTTTGIVTIVGNVSGSPFATGGIGLGNSTGTVNITGNVVAPNFSGITNGGSGIINILGNISGVGTGLANNSTGTVNLIGNVTGGSGSATVGISNFLSGIVNVQGNAIGGTGVNCFGIGAAGTGTVNLTGNCIGGINDNRNTGITNSGSTAIVNIFGNVFANPNLGAGLGVLNTSTGFINITGNLISGAVGSVANNSTGTVTVLGTVTGGIAANTYGIQNASTGTVIVSGSAVGGIGSAAYGAYNASTGILRVKRAVGNNWGLGYTTALAAVPGVFSNVQGSQTFVEELECGPRGQWPTGGVVFFTPNTKATSMFETDTFQNYTLIQSNSADNLLPSTSSVRRGISYNLGLNTGTCILPPTSSVALNVLVDNLTGTAVLTPQTTWNYSVTASDVNSMGGRLENALNANSAGTLINSFNP